MLLLKYQLLMFRQSLRLDVCSILTRLQHCSDLLAPVCSFWNLSGPNMSGSHMIHSKFLAFPALCLPGGIHLVLLLYDALLFIKPLQAQLIEPPVACAGSKTALS